MHVLPGTTHKYTIPLSFREFLDDSYAMNTFYNHVGELNDIIVLYPQVITSVANPVNPEGCWDWWGYNDSGVGSTGDYGKQRLPIADSIVVLPGTKDLTTRYHCIVVLQPPRMDHRCKRLN